MNDSEIYALILKDFHRIILNSSAMWLNVLDTDGNVIMWNKAAERISGYSNDEVLGSGEIWALLYPDEAYREKIYSKALEIIEQGEEVTDFETTIRCKDGSIRTLFWNSHDAKDEQGEVIGSVALARDITEIHASEKKLVELTSKLEESNKQLLHLSEIDGLTGLYNRRYMDNLLRYEWERHLRSSSLLSLIYVDIDFFKEYNDSYGHLMGDKALIEVAGILKNNTKRYTDKLSRFGGEEFSLILPETSLSDAAAIAKKLHQAVLEKNIEHGGSKISDILTISVGVATVVPSVSQTIDDLKNEADKALYQAKELGRNCVAKMKR